MGEINNSKVGVVRFDCNFKEKKSVVAINLNPRIEVKVYHPNYLVYQLKKFFISHQFTLCAIIKKITLKVKRYFLGVGLF